MVVALKSLGHCLMKDCQFKRALALLERSLSIKREHLPGDHFDLADGKIICIILEMLHIDNRRNSS